MGPRCSLLLPPLRFPAFVLPLWTVEAAHLDDMLEEMKKKEKKEVDNVARPVSPRRHSSRNE